MRCLAEYFYGNNAGIENGYSRAASVKWESSCVTSGGRGIGRCIVLSTAECGCCRKRHWFLPGIIGTDILLGTMKFAEADTKAILHEHILLSLVGASKDPVAR